MSAEFDLHGVYVPLVTPFDSKGEVAYDDLKRLAIESVDAGAAGLVALGTTGEPATLDDVETNQVIEVIGSVCRERNVSFIVGAGGNNTKAVATHIAAAANAGADAILSVVPYYTRPTE